MKERGAHVRSKELIGEWKTSKRICGSLECPLYLTRSKMSLPEQEKDILLWEGVMVDSSYPYVSYSRLGLIVIRFSEAHKEIMLSKLLDKNLRLIHLEDWESKIVVSWIDIGLGCDRYPR